MAMFNDDLFQENGHQHQCCIEEMNVRLIFRFLSKCPVEKKVVTFVTK